MFIRMLVRGTLSFMNDETTSTFFSLHGAVVCYTTRDCYHYPSPSPASSFSEPLGTKAHTSNKLHRLETIGSDRVQVLLLRSEQHQHACS